MSIVLTYAGFGFFRVAVHQPESDATWGVKLVQSPDLGRVLISDWTIVVHEKIHLGDYSGAGRWSCKIRFSRNA